MLVKVHRNFRLKTSSWDGTKKSKKITKFKVLLHMHDSKNKLKKSCMSSMILKKKFWFNLFNFDGEGVQHKFFAIQKSQEDNWIEKIYKILKC